MNDENNTPASTIRKSVSETRKGAIKRHRAIDQRRSHGVRVPKSPRSHSNVVYIEDWLMRVVEERHALASSPVVKAAIERWMMSLPAFVAGDDVPA